MISGFEIMDYVALLKILKRESKLRRLHSFGWVGHLVKVRVERPLLIVTVYLLFQ